MARRPYSKKDIIDLLDKVQKELLHWWQDKSAGYYDRLQLLRLTTLETRRLKY